MLRIFYKLNILECLLVFGFPLMLKLNITARGYFRTVLLLFTVIATGLIAYEIYRSYTLLSSCVLRNTKLRKDQEFSWKINLGRFIVIGLLVFGMIRMFQMYTTNSVIYWETSVYIILVCVFNLRVMTRIHYSLSRRKRKYVLWDRSC